ncbi:tyrosinase family protein [Mycolicibacterium sp. XJ870]
MTFTRQDAWALSADETWPETLVWYARAVRAMQAKPFSDPTSWRYQSAIHGLANTPPPPGAPWNECQHASWYFAPWHRMYLHHFEEIVRAEIIALNGPSDWALPYWNYERSAKALEIPPAFTEPTLDGSANPLRVQQRRSAVNAGMAMPPDFASSVDAMSDTEFVTPPSGIPGGFGGPMTGFHHGMDGAKGDLENQPHDIIHGWVGGLMNNPDTAARDPIFWLHHANIDRLWESWRIKTGNNPTAAQWLNKTFQLRDKSGALVRMAVSEVLNTEKLNYTYDKLPAEPPVAAVAPQPRERIPMSQSKVKTVAQQTEPLELGRDGASAELAVGALPRAAVAGAEPRFYVRLADITGVSNPDVIYGVYVNLPDGADDATRKKHRVGLVSFFGIEHTAGSKDAKPLSYSFDATAVVADDAAAGKLDELRVALLPEEGTETEPSGAALAAPPINVGTVALSVAHE